MGKGSKRRNGEGFEIGWEMIFGADDRKTTPPPTKPTYAELERTVERLRDEINRLQGVVWDRM